MSNVFNVNSGQECQIHVELISMSITDFTYSQVGLTRPRSWSRHVLTQLPICCQHHLVCLFVWCCINALYGSVGHTGSKTKQSIWLFCFFSVTLCFFFSFLFIVCSCSEIFFLKFIPRSFRLFWLMAVAGVSDKKSGTRFCFVPIEAFPFTFPFRWGVCQSPSVCGLFWQKYEASCGTFCLFVSSFLLSKFKISLYLFRKTGRDPWANAAEERLLLQSVS